VLGRAPGVNRGAVGLKLRRKIRRQSLGRELGDARGLGGLGGRVIVLAGNEVDENGGLLNRY